MAEPFAAFEGRAGRASGRRALEAARPREATSAASSRPRSSSWGGRRVRPAFGRRRRPAGGRPRDTNRGAGPSPALHEHSSARREGGVAARSTRSSRAEMVERLGRRRLRAGSERVGRHREPGEARRRCRRVDPVVLARAEEETNEEDDEVDENLIAARDRGAAARDASGSRFGRHLDITGVRDQRLNGEPRPGRSSSKSTPRSRSGTRRCTSSARRPGDLHRRRRADRRARGNDRVRPRSENGAVRRAPRSGTTVLATGGKPGEAYKPSVWENSSAAYAAGRGESTSGRSPTLKAGLEEYPEQPALYYHLACVDARREARRCDRAPGTRRRARPEAAEVGADRRGPRRDPRDRLRASGSETSRVPARRRPLLPPSRPGRTPSERRRRPRRERSQRRGRCAS